MRPPASQYPLVWMHRDGCGAPAFYLSYSSKKEMSGKPKQSGRVWPPVITGGHVVCMSCDANIRDHNMWVNVEERT